MLEKNHLYRKIERHNLFRTFSRGYSRPTHSSASAQPTPSHTVDFTAPYNESLLKTMDQQQENRFKTITSKALTHRLQHNLNLSQRSKEKSILNETSYLKKQQNSASVQEVNRYERKLIHSEAGSRTVPSQINSQSSFPVWNHRNHQKFKLKSYLEKKPVHYETQWDESDFSILEMKRKTIMEKYQQTLLKQTGKYRLMGEPSHFSKTMSKKGSSQLTKYSIMLQQNKARR